MTNLIVKLTINRDIEKRLLASDRDDMKPGRSLRFSKKFLYKNLFLHSWGACCSVSLGPFCDFWSAPAANCCRMVGCCIGQKYGCVGDRRFCSQSKAFSGLQGLSGARLGDIMLPWGVALLLVEAVMDMSLHSSDNQSFI